MNIFITGSTGFIGKYLIKSLAKKRYKIIALVRNEVQSESLAKLGIQTVIGDITNPSTFTKALNQSDVLIHMVGIRSNWGKPEDFINVNAKSFERLLTPKTHLKHLIVFSSVYVFGSIQNPPADENTPCLAKDIYGRSKILLEEVVKKTSAEYNIPYTIIRPAIVYGPNDNEQGMIVKMVKLIKSKRLPIIGKGQNKLHLIYIDDLVDGVIKIIKHQGQNQTYILAYQKPITQEKLVNIIKENLKIKYTDKFYPRLPMLIIAYCVEQSYKFAQILLPYIFQSEPPLTPIKVRTLSDDSYYNISKANHDLQFKPQINYEKGLKKTLEGTCNLK